MGDQNSTLPPDMSPTLDKDNITKIQQFLVTFLYYERMVDPTLLVALSDLETQQTKETDITLKNLNKLLDYCCKFPNEVIRYTKSDMLLKVHSDAGYLNVVGSKSRSGGYVYMGNKPYNNNDNNGGVLTNATILKNIMASAAEAEYGALFNNSRLALPLRMVLENLGHSQPPTPIFTDNLTSQGLANESLKMGQSKFMDMRFHLIRDRIKQGHFQILWLPGSNNKADYFSKHHSPTHHRKMRPIYLQLEASMN